MPRKEIVLALLFMLILTVLWSLRSEDPHDFTEKCYICHVGMKDPSILTREVNRLCLFCHPDSDTRSHPSNFVPQMSLPEQFPLFGNKMACTTCHFPHSIYTQNEDLGDPVEQGPFLLRSESEGKLFCYACHQGNFTNFQDDSHAISMNRAHAKPISFELKGEVDDNSRDCLSCHDGILSIQSDIDLGGISWEHTRNIGLSHPISVNYAEVYTKNPNRFHSPERLDSRIVLINGEIGCETCHDHYSEIENKLVMDNFRSRLCLSCHNL